MNNRYSHTYRKRAPSTKGMNKTEQRYYDYLTLLQKAGEIDSFGYEKIKLKLANLTTYTPDFLVVKDGIIELHEVKGFWEDDARVKIKVAAEQFYYFKFIAIKLVKGAWVIEDF